MTMIEPVRPLIGTDLTPSGSVPLFTVSLVQPDFDQWATIGVVLGNRVEADLAALEAVEPGLGLRVARYWERCRSFWDLVAGGDRPTNGLHVERALIAHRQSTTTTDRRDLNEVLEVLDRVPVVSEIVESALSTKPDWDVLRRNGLSTEVTHRDDVTVISFLYPGRHDWDTQLGGVCSRGEIGRRVEIVVSHAKWRDRRSRRLVSVDVFAREVWPDPKNVIPVQPRV